MPNIPRVVSTPVAYVPLFSICFARRLILCLLLTAFNVSVIALFAPTLYQATAAHPLWLIGVSLLLAALLGSLARVWVLSLRGWFR